MKFEYKSYRVEFECSFDGNQIICEGYSWGDYKYLKFPIGCFVKVKFGHKTVSAQIQGYTKTKVVLIVESGQEKRISFSDLISHNHLTEITIRIEKNGVGPYRCKVSPENTEFLQWKQEASRLFHEDEVSRYHRPSPEEDGVLAKYYTVGRLSTFGFKSFDQMFEWFPLSDVLFLVKHGFSIEIKQKGLDYHESLCSYRQVAMIKDKFKYEELLSSPIREYY